MAETLYKNIFERNTVLIHFAFWVLVLHLLFDISGLYYSFREIFIEGNQQMDDAFIIVPLMISLFYWNTHILIPKFLNRKSWWRYLVGITLSFFFFLFTGQMISLFLKNKGYFLEINSEDFLDYSLLFYFLTIAISTSLGVSKIAMQNSTKQKEAEAKQKEAELKFLTAQVNPHFLFNSLNTIYSLSTEEEADKTTDAILKLSEIMRYPLKEGLQKNVPLKSEIDFLKSFIELQKIRLGQSYPIHFEVKGNIKNVKVAPLLFISFIENAFKYGVSQRDAKPINISILCQKDSIHFHCKNDIVKSNNSSSHGLGINNINTRLQLLYDKKHTLKISDSNQKYIVDLEIKI